MTNELPDDLIAFLGAGRQFDYDADNSVIGRITLKRAADLSLTTIMVYPGCQSIIDDPYSDIEGLYQCDIYDLVAESEDYAPEGLICWIPALKRFGCIDPEHGDVITFPNVTWTDIAANPLPYLDSQWGDDYHVAVRVLPWIYFPFKPSATDVVIAPYGARCPVHNTPVTAQRCSKPHLFSVYQQRNKDEWLQKRRTTFPCSGVPVTDDDLLCCPDCRAAEDAWIKFTVDSISPADATPNAHGWVQCPGCGTRFMITDSGVFSEGIHLNCGQRINVVR